MKLTGERVTTPEGGFNPTWQRHVAAYGLCSRFLSQDLVLDVGCGIGHSHELLAPRPAIGFDLDPVALRAQRRPMVCADMRRLPVADGVAGSVVSVQSIEHVPDPERALAEMRRAVRRGGVVVVVTPNKLTFARPDEVIDPWHYVEFDARELAHLAESLFDAVELWGIFGSPAYLEFQATELRRLSSVLRADPLRFRRFVPRRARQLAYSFLLRRSRSGSADPLALRITRADFELGSDALDSCLDLVAVCRSDR